MNNAKRVFLAVLLGTIASPVIAGDTLTSDIYPLVEGANYGPAEGSLSFVDTDPGPTIGGTLSMGRAQDEAGIDMYMAHWGLEVGQPGIEDDAGNGDHGGSCKGFRDTTNIGKVLVSESGDLIQMEIPQDTVVPDKAVYFVAHTIYNGRHNLAKCIQIPIENRID